MNIPNIVTEARSERKKKRIYWTVYETIANENCDKSHKNHWKLSEKTGWKTIVQLLVTLNHIYIYI